MKLLARAPLFVAALAALPLTACVIVTPPPPPPGAQPGGAPAAVANGIVQGAPPHERTGGVDAVYVWVDHGLWRVRLVSATGQHRFTGTVKPVQGGEITLAKSSRPETQDRFRQTPGGVSFDYQIAPSPAHDGFDLTTSPNACLDVEVTFDAKSDATKVFLGGSEQVAPSSHFTACP